MWRDRIATAHWDFPILCGRRDFFFSISTNFFSIVCQYLRFVRGTQYNTIQPLYCASVYGSTVKTTINTNKFNRKLCGHRKYSNIECELWIGEWWSDRCNKMDKRCILISMVVLGRIDWQTEFASYTIPYFISTRKCAQSRRFTDSTHICMANECSDL